jgi:hypothetical protein
MYHTLTEAEASKCMYPSEMVSECGGGDDNNGNGNLEGTALGSMSDVDMVEYDF